MKFALITGINGQDGSYLSELLLEKNYEVYGIIRRSSNFNTTRIDHIFNRLNLFYGDVTDPCNLVSILNKIKINMANDSILEIYHLAAQSHVKVSFELPGYSTQVNALGTLYLLDGIIASNMKDKVVLINFWATWCGPCRLEIPDFNELYNKYNEKGLEIFSLINSENEKN